jgi:hypothetical protein
VVVLLSRLSPVGTIPACRMALSSRRQSTNHHVFSNGSCAFHGAERCRQTLSVQLRKRAYIRFARQRGDGLWVRLMDSDRGKRALVYRDISCDDGRRGFSRSDRLACLMVLQGHGELIADCRGGCLRRRAQYREMDSGDPAWWEGENLSLLRC